MAIAPMQLVKVTSSKDDILLMVDQALNCASFHPLKASDMVAKLEKGIAYPNPSIFIDLKNRLDHIEDVLQLGIGADLDKSAYDMNEINAVVDHAEKILDIYFDGNKRKLLEKDIEVLQRLDDYTLENSEEDFIVLRFGRIPIKSLSNIFLYNQEKFVYTELDRDKYFAWIIYTCLKEDAQHFAEMFQTLYFEPIMVPKKQDSLDRDSLREEINHVYGKIAYQARVEAFMQYLVAEDERVSFYAFVDLKAVQGSVLYPIFSTEDREAHQKLIGLKDKHDTFVNVVFGKMPLSCLVRIAEISQERFVYTELMRKDDTVWITYTALDEDLEAIKEKFASLSFTELAIYGEESGLEPKIARFRAMFDPRISIATLNPHDYNIATPTKLNNSWLFKPYEMMIEMYGLPLYGTFDPTVFFAITYSFLFGMMFGDLGQGFVISVLGYYLYRKKNMVLGAIMARIGVFSMFFGFLYGSVFGNEEILHPILAPLGLPIEVGSSEMTMPLLYTAVGLGVILILSSMILNVIVLCRQRRFVEAFLTQNGLAGLVFYSYLISALVLSVLNIANILSLPYLLVFIGIPLGLILFYHPIAHLLEKKKASPDQGWGNYIVESLFELFEIVLSFLTNTMSFLRVGGFVLSHVGMMMVVTQLQAMSGAASFLVFIFGNLLVIGLEGMIVGIQALRLEYYEMFSRYYESGGVKFESL